MARSYHVWAGRFVGGAFLCATVAGTGAQVAQAAGTAAGSESSPVPAVAELNSPPTDSVSGSAGLYAVGGGLVMVAGGAALWVRRHRAGKVTIH